MKKIIFALILFCAAVNANAQYTPLINEQYVWKGTMYGLITMPFWQKLDGNEQVGDMLYTRVYSGNSYNSMDYQVGLIREDVEEMKVYAYDGTSEHLLYDFTAVEGESILTWGIGGEKTIEITSVETVSVDGTPRKKINFEDSWGPAYWIEGIGSVYGIMDGALGPVADYNPEVNCFYKSESLIWSNPENTGTCALTLAVNESQYIQMNAWPNPSSGSMNISADASLLQGTASINVISALGKIVYSKNISANGMMRIEIPQLSAGMYFLTISQDQITRGCLPVIFE